VISRRAVRVSHTPDDDPLTLLASAIDPQIEEWPIERLCHYQARWVWPPSFTDSREWQPFVDDVRAVGIHEPLIVLPDGQVVDGGHRLDAARAIALKTAPVRVLSLPLPLSDADRFALENWAVMGALARRRLDRHETQGLIIDLEHAMADLQASGVTIPLYRRDRIARLAELLGMSATHTKRVLAIAHRGSQELRSRVKAGTLAVDTAYRILTGKIGEASPGADGVPAWQSDIDRLIAESAAMLSIILGVALASDARERERRDAARVLEDTADEVAQLRETVREWCESAA
jgi:hypothetical protein